MMDTEEYQRLKNLAEGKLRQANMHIIGDTVFTGIGLAIEGQAYATLAAAEASRPVPSRRAVAAATSMTYELPPDLGPQSRKLPTGFRRLPAEEGTDDPLPPLSNPADETPPRQLS